MAQNKLDKLVITLQTTLEGLVTKVNGLEQLIGEQNILIKKQGEKIQELLSLSTDTHNARTSTEAETKPAPRTARLRASAAIVSGANNSKSTNSTSKTLPKTPTDARSGALASAAIARTTRRTSVTESYACVATPPATATAPLTKPTPQCLVPEPPHEKNTIETVDEEDWEKVTRRPQKNNRRERAVIRGSGVFTCDLQTVERAKKIHACFFKPDTSEETLKAFMEQKNASNAYEVMKMKLKHNHYSSFVITVPESKYDFFMSADNWPAGTEVSEWFRRGAGRAVRPLHRRSFHGPANSKPTTSTEA